MIKEKIIEKIADETINISMECSRIEQITKYIELWEKYNVED